MVLCRHLERERQCLFDLASLLDDEADALRRMALTELEDYAHRKEVMLNEQLVPIETPLKHAMSAASAL